MMTLLFAEVKYNQANEDLLFGKIEQGTTFKVPEKQSRNDRMILGCLIMSIARVKLGQLKRAWVDADFNDKEIAANFCTGLLPGVREIQAGQIHEIQRYSTIFPGVTLCYDFKYNKGKLIDKRTYFDIQDPNS